MNLLKKLSPKVSLVLIVALILAMCTPFLDVSPTYAKETPKAKVEKELLYFEEVRLDKHTKATKVREFKEKGQEMQEWEAVISSLPQTMPDLETLIICEWLEGESDDGITYYETGNNLFYSRVTGTRVSVENEGVLAAWDPLVYLGGTQLELVKGPELVKDQFDDTYGENTIYWTYQEPKGFLDFGEKKEITRYVRQIEGVLLEYYILEENPRETLRIKNNYQEEAGFRWNSEVWAQDSKGLRVKVEGSQQEKVVDWKELGRPELTYPVTIDPTTSFTSADNRWEWESESSSYTTARTAPAAYHRSTSTLSVGQELIDAVGYGYTIWRTPLYFDTSSLPENAAVTSGYVSLYGVYWDPNSNFYIRIQDGGDYPSNPPLDSDYYYGHYSGDGGSFYTSSWNSDGYNYITLSAAGRGWVDTTGWTIFMLRSSDDIDGSPPADWNIEWVDFRSDLYGISYQPKLSLTYYLAITKPIVRTDPADLETGSTARLWGYLTDDGGADSDTWFDYGTTTSYGQSTTSTGIKGTGESFLTTVYGLEYGTLYHYTARAQNIGGTSDADNVTFLTLPNTPTGFTVTPGDTENALAWTKGTGSGRTMIRRSTSSYPTTITSGTQVYFDTSNSYNDTTLTNGTTYYYSVWAEKTSGALQQYSASKTTGSGVPYVAGPPTLTTYAATSIEDDSMVLNGYLVDLGGEASVTCSFLYDEDGDGFLDETTTVVLSDLGQFSKTISTLVASTTYEFKAKGVGNGTGYGSELHATTGDPSPPTMTTQSETGVQQDQATLWGKVTDDGGAVVTAWFEWGYTTSYGETTDTAVGLYTNDQLYETLLSLGTNTTYHYRVVGQNEEGIGYGADGEFTTDLPDEPAVSVQAATDIGASSATLHGLLTDDGGVDTSVRFAWSTNMTVSENITFSGWQTDKRTGDTFTHFATNMTYDTTHYYISQAENGGGSVNSTAIKSFTTVFSAPEDFAVTALTSTSIGLSWEPMSDKTLIVARAGSYPADRLDGEQVYFGTGSSTSYEGLTVGTTYFFRAWSWRDGDNYSAAYAEDATTTLSGVRPEDIGTPRDTADVNLPGAPDNWWQGPGSDKIQNWPVVPYIDSVADDMGMDRGAMWIIFAGILAVLVGAAGATMIPLRLAGFGAGLTSVALLAGVGVIEGWIVMFYLIVGIALLVLLPAEGG